VERVEDRNRLILLLIDYKPAEIELISPSIQFDMIDNWSITVGLTLLSPDE
jgi:hypothetical protein